MERITGRKLQRRRKRLLSQQPLCVHCLARGLTVAAVELDHIVPLHAGGSDVDESNLQPLCQDCHDVKTSRERRSGWGRRPVVRVCVHGDFMHQCGKCNGETHSADRPTQSAP